MVAARDSLSCTRIRWGKSWNKLTAHWMTFMHLLMLSVKGDGKMSIDVSNAAKTRGKNDERIYVMDDAEITIVAPDAARLDIYDDRVEGNYPGRYTRIIMMVDAIQKLEVT